MAGEIDIRTLQKKRKKKLKKRKEGTVIILKLVNLKVVWVKRTLMKIANRNPGLRIRRNF